MLTFNALLESVGLRLTDVRLLRHADTRHSGKPTPYVLWRDRPDLFEAYQRTQSPDDRAKLAAPHWAAFVRPADGRTLFAGLFLACRRGVLEEDRINPEIAWVQQPGVDDDYDVTRDERLSNYVGRITIDWGAGHRSWIQRAHLRVKPIIELAATFQEPTFPGYARLILNLSELDSLPATWRSALAAASGVYLLSCPRSREQYVASHTARAAFSRDGLTTHRRAMAGTWASRDAIPPITRWRSCRRSDQRPPWLN